MTDHAEGQAGPSRSSGPDAGADRRRRLNERLRHAFIEGAEEDSRRRLGRGLTAEELERVGSGVPALASSRHMEEP